MMTTVVVDGGFDYEYETVHGNTYAWELIEIKV